MQVEQQTVIHRRRVHRSVTPARYARRVAAVLLLIASLAAGPAAAVGLNLSPGPVSNGIHDGNASVTVTLIDADLVSGYADFAVRAAFVDTTQPFDLTIGFDSAVVASVTPRLLGSPAGGSIAWSNPSASPIAAPILSLSCNEAGMDNECRYRFRLGLTAAPLSGEIAGVPVAYDLAPPVPALPVLGRLVLGALLLVLGVRARS